MEHDTETSLHSFQAEEPHTVASAPHARKYSVAVKELDLGYQNIYIYIIK